MYTTELWFCEPNGRVLLELPKYKDASMSWQANRINTITVSYPFSLELIPYLKRDKILQLIIGPEGYPTQTFLFFLRYWQVDYTPGKRRILLKGVGPNDILRRRIVAHYANSAEATCSGIQADNVLKDIWDDAFADGTNPAPTYGTRAVSSLTREWKESDAANITKSFAWKRLLERNGAGVFGEIATLAEQTNGVKLYFGVEPRFAPNGEIDWILQTSINQYGRDLSNAFILDETSSALLDAKVTFDYLEEANYVYAGGMGLETDREIAQVQSSGDVGASEYNRCETFADRSNLAGNSLTAAATEALFEGLGKLGMRATLMSSGAALFGRDWNFGDRIGLSLWPYIGWGNIDSGTIKISNSGIDIQAKLEGNIYG